MCSAVLHRACNAGLQETYLPTMDAVDRVVPKAALFILQGPQQQGSSAAQWGSGFSTDPGLLRLGVTGEAAAQWLGS